VLIMKKEITVIPIGTVFGDLTVTSEPFKSGGETFYLCKCKCGKTTRARGYSLKAKKTVRCIDCTRAISKKHHTAFCVAAFHGGKR